MLKLPIAATMGALAAQTVRATPTLSPIDCRPMCTCVGAPLSSQAAQWRQAADSGVTFLRDVRWFVGTATGVASVDSARPASEPLPRVIGRQPPDNLTTFSVERSWARDPAVAAMSVVRIVSPTMTLCPVPKWVPGSRYLVIVAPDSIGRLYVGFCNWAIPADDTAATSAVKVLGTPKWRRGR